MHFTPPRPGSPQPWPLSWTHLPLLPHCLLLTELMGGGRSGWEPELSPDEVAEESSPWVFSSCLGLGYAGYQAQWDLNL